MNNHPLISYIIPAKNSSSTIANSILSIQKSFSDDSTYEILVILHFKTDKTYQTIKRIFNNKNIHILFTNTNGISISRNLGLKMAKGDYIAFLDSDDTIFQNGINYYIKMVQTKYDVYFGNFSNSHCNSLFINKLVPEDKLDAFFSQPFLVSAIWQYYYKREFLNSKNILFDEKLMRDEDGEFCSKLFTNNPLLFVTDKNFINYNKTNKGLSHNFSLDGFSSMVQSYSLIYQNLSKANYLLSIIRWSNNYVDILLFYIAIYLPPSQYKMIIKVIKNSYCPSLLKMSTHKKPKFFYYVFGYKLTWVLLRYIRGRKNVYKQ